MGEWLYAGMGEEQCRTPEKGTLWRHSVLSDSKLPSITTAKTTPNIAHSYGQALPASHRDYFNGTRRSKITYFEVWVRKLQILAFTVVHGAPRCPFGLLPGHTQRSLAGRGIPLRRQNSKTRSGPPPVAPETYSRKNASCRVTAKLAPLSSVYKIELSTTIRQSQSAFRVPDTPKDHHA